MKKTNSEKKFWREATRWMKRQQATEGSGKRTVSDPSKAANDPMLVRLQTYLQKRYAFRYNLLTEQTEYSADGGKQFLPVTRLEMNTFCLDAHTEGVNCWDKDVERLMNSEKVADYHPFLAYMEQLPQWDGTDRVTPLAQRVSDNALWTVCFHRWLLGVTAQWEGRRGRSANSFAPLLVSSEQGRCKSTFCRLLMPESLQPYYLDKFDLTAESACERKLAFYGLINMDEFDRYTVRQTAVLKNLMQLVTLPVRRAYHTGFSALPRIASFIGTSNRKDLLNDPTGSRRYFCIEVKEKIDCSPLAHNQLFAQLKAELARGERYWFTGDEEIAIQEHNRSFYMEDPGKELFHACFRLPAPGEPCEELTATEIYCRIRKRYPGVLRTLSPNSFAKMLVASGAERVHRKFGNVYRVQLTIDN